MRKCYPDAAQQIVLLKVGQAGARRQNGLRGRLGLHLLQHPDNTVWARHLVADALLGELFNYVPADRERRREFVLTRCRFRALPMEGAAQAQIDDSEAALEAMHPRHIGVVQEAGYGPLNWVAFAAIDPHLPEREEGAQ